eukprot:NODE_5017_length_1819_cov_7.210993.p1 GENE.NODE_5017_length_1819_cov_7.210993~~NODE_5017_length_1819_cov_7.210993.p1  ORF type:complete len:505 (+),score=208.65 NODE_5017_length_1819_cov_7.210993:98-1612(+)
MVQALSVVLDAASVSQQDLQKVVALAQSSSCSSGDAPAGAAYESHGGSILELLEGLREKAIAELEKARKEEETSTHNFQMMKESLEDHKAVQEKDMAKAKAAKAAAVEIKATAENDLVASKKDIAATQEAVAALNEGCAQAAADHEESNKHRGEELKALGEAKKALVDSTSGAERVVYSFLQEGDDSDDNVENMVRRLSKNTHSATLAQLASRIGAVMSQAAVSEDNPFGKVKGLINNLLEKLETEADAQADQKTFCDRETKYSQEKLAAIQHNIAKLTAKADADNGESEQLKDEVGEVLRELADLADSQVEMDKVRKEEHGVYQQTLKDLEEGLAGMRLALKVLREHFGNPSFLQQPAVHVKSTGAVRGIVAMLEVIESDLVKSITECKDVEQSAVNDYTKMSHENQLTKASKDQDVKHKRSKAAALDKSAGEFGSDLQSAQAELSAAVKASDSLREQCVVKVETYEERRQKREAEIDGLKEALDVLATQAALVQRRRPSGHH